MNFTAQNLPLTLAAFIRFSQNMITTEQATEEFTIFLGDGTTPITRDAYMVTRRIGASFIANRAMRVILFEAFQRTQNEVSFCFPETC